MSGLFDRQYLSEWPRRVAMQARTPSRLSVGSLVARVDLLTVTRARLTSDFILGTVSVVNPDGTVVVSIHPGQRLDWPGRNWGRGVVHATRIMELELRFEDGSLAFARYTLCGYKIAFQQKAGSEALTCEVLGSVTCLECLSR